MSLRFSHSSFPCTAAQKDSCGLPWGLVLQPLAPLAHASSSTKGVTSAQVARCQNCLGYINPYCQFLPRGGGWRCSLCRAQNQFPRAGSGKKGSAAARAAAERYADENNRHRVEELVLPDVEFSWVEEGDEADGKRSGNEDDAEDEEAEAEAAERAAIAAFEASRDPSLASYDPSATLVQPFAPSARASVSPPAYVFLVDLSAEHGVLELVKQALLAALEALPSTVWVGLCVVSSRVGLFDLKCAVPTVVYTTVRSSAAASASGAPSLDDAPTSLPLSMLLPLDAFLQKLAHCKEHLAAAIESLQSHAPRTDISELVRQASSESSSNQGREQQAFDELDPEAGGGGGGGAAAPSAASPTPSTANPMRRVPSLPSFSSSSSSSAPSPSVRSNPCGFGAALAALLVYLSSVSEQGLQLNARILSFLSQRPNYGLGALPDRSASGVDEDGNLRAHSADDSDRFEFRAFEGPMAASDHRSFAGGSGSGQGSSGGAKGAMSAAHARARSLFAGVVGSSVSSRSCAGFYREVATSAAQRGVCIDLYVVAPSGSTSSSSSTAVPGSSSSAAGTASSPAHIELATLKYLSLLTGGNLLFYPSARDCALPQDLFRQLRSPQAFRCLLRLRCSPAMHVSNVYGHLVADETLPDLFHAGGCDARKSYAMDLDFSSGTSGSFKGNNNFGPGGGETLPTIQVAFSYIAVQIGLDGVERVEHRLRVLTRQMPLVFHAESHVPRVATKEVREELLDRGRRQGVSELFASAAPEVVLALLVQQLIHASLERGVAEARLMLRDWLVGMMIAYHDVFSKKTKDEAMTPAAAVAAAAKAKANAATEEEEEEVTIDSLDLGLSQAPNLQFLPRFVCALLKSPLLAITSGGGPVKSLAAASVVQQQSLASGSSSASSADARVYLHLLYSGLECDYIVRSIYPTLSSFALELDPTIRDPATGAFDPARERELATTAAVAGGAGLSLAARQAKVSLRVHHPVLYLTRFSLSGCGDQVFLLDSFVHLRVLYLSSLFNSSLGRAGLVAFPPPPSSELQRQIKKLKAAAPYLTPKVLFAAEDGADVSIGAAAGAGAGGGKDAARHFLECMIEDESGGGHGGGAFSFQAFMQEVGKEMLLRMREARQQQQ